MTENEDAERAASDAEPEEESDLDAGLTSDSSPLKSGSSAASGSMHDRKRSMFLMAYTGANGAADTRSEGVASASDYWKDGLAPDSIDGNALFVQCDDACVYGSESRSDQAVLPCHARAVRVAVPDEAPRRDPEDEDQLSELEQTKPASFCTQPNNAWRPYGFNKTNSTFDTLAALITPLRQRQVLDEWTALEIATFEEAFEKFDRKFHLIADQLPNKSVKDVIALFYVWKRHGSCAKYTDFDDDDDDLPEPDMPAETKYMIQQLKRRQACTREYIGAARCLFAPRSAPLSNHKRAKISDFGLQGVPNLKSAVHGTSLLRSISPLDSWTPIEIRVFEVAIECYGKDFHRVARVIGTKTCRETIALYYIWKKDPHYQAVKNRWGKNEIYQSRKDFVASAHHPAAAATSATES